MTKYGKALLAGALICGAMAVAQAPQGGAPQQGGPQQGGPGMGQMMGPGGPGGPGGQAIAGSATVNADNSVTFTYKSADARSVKLSVGYPFVKVGGTGPSANKAVDLTKNDQGVWSVTLSPVRPDIYSYTFNVDGKAETAKTLVMKSDQTDLYKQNSKIAHGTVAKVWYDSKIFSNSRRMVIYTPPGYETSAARYPVLYLLHGGGGDELVWSGDQGRATYIFDNLIAQGKMVPSIVVMTKDGTGSVGYSTKDDSFATGGGMGSPGGMMGAPGGQAGPGGQPGPGMGAPGGQGGNGGKNARVEFLRSLTDEVVPFIDKTYRTRADANSRAVGGYSGGAGESIFVGLNNPDTFTWIGAFSPGWPDVPANFWTVVPPPVDAAMRRGPELGKNVDPAVFLSLVPNLSSAVNSKIHLFYFGIGDADGLLETEQTLNKLFTDKGVKFDWVVKHDYGHEFSLWRINLTEFAQRVFRPAK